MVPDHTAQAGERITVLANGNYVISSPNWDEFERGQDRGAVTWRNGNGGTVGAVSALNSLVGWR